jgi:hypothetical protein
MDLEDEEFMDFSPIEVDKIFFNEAPQRPKLIKYLVAGNTFEVTEKYSLQYAIGQG